MYTFKQTMYKLYTYIVNMYILPDCLSLRVARSAKSNTSNMSIAPIYDLIRINISLQIFTIRVTLSQYVQMYVDFLQ